ncbi:C1 family peptidase [Symbiopectobacterium sp. Eva_TO]
MLADLVKRRKRGLGYIPDLPDIRDYTYQPKDSVMSSLPRNFNIEIDFPVYDQGKIGSCTANALAAAFQFERKKHRELPDFMPSRLFIYFNERFIERSINYDSGASLRDGIKSLHKVGCCPESIWPYDDTPADESTGEFPANSLAKKKPSDQCYENARQHFITQYHRIKQDINHIKFCLASGSPFVFGFTVYSNWFNQKELPVVIPMPSEKDNVEGGHAVLCVGYDDSKELFKFRNSWGDSLGEKGYFYIPYDYLLDKRLSSDFWVITCVKS